jgi:hypothetical protein
MIPETLAVGIVHRAAQRRDLFLFVRIALFCCRGAPMPSGAARRTPQLIHPKISLTLSKIVDPRSAGLFSTFSDAPSCSTNLRCSRVNFVGVSTRT